VATGPEFVALVATCMAMAAMSIDFMLPAFPEMREEFGLAPDSNEVARLVTTFFLGLAVGQLVYGPLSDRFGRRKPLYAGLVIYAIGATACALTPTLGATVAFRFVWGFGAAAPRSLALAMIRDSFEGDRMARTMSHVMATFILVPVFAPAVGAAAMVVAPWRIVFWIPVAAAGGLALWMLRLPETLPPERRRSVSPSALWEALRLVFRSRETVAFGLAVTFLFGIMTSYVASSQLIFEDVYDQDDLFPLLFGLIACMLGVGSLLSARLVMQMGIAGLVRAGAFYMLAATGLFTVLVLATDGKPPLWAFCVACGLMLPGVTVLVPNCNTAAMGPVAHVAGMAAAVLGTLSTAGGALLGSMVDEAIDGSVRPFALGALVYGAVAAFAILVLARRVPTAPPETVVAVAHEDSGWTGGPALESPAS
jgi:DHA1 family bicyclomycin/chloramphenicol resistance-like MFS transporter